MACPCYASFAEDAGDGASKLRAFQGGNNVCHLMVGSGQRRLVNVHVEHDEGECQPKVRQYHKLADTNPLENEGTGLGNYTVPSLDGTDHRSEENNGALARGIQSPLCPSKANIYPK